jgi:uncharacterized protein (DUF983 family)
MPRIKVSRAQILQRAVLHQCPNCGGRPLFKGAFQLQPSCPTCGLTLERGDGFFLGAMSLNYGITVCGVLAPVTLLWMAGVLPGDWAVGLGLGGAVLFPLVFYRTSRSLWLGFYYYFLPQELPANRSKKSAKPD